MKIASEGVLRHWPDAVYLQMDYSDQRYGGLVAVAVLDADGEELDGGNMELWDELDNGADVSVLIGNLDDDRGDWSVHRTYATSEARASGVNPFLDIKMAAAMTTKEIGSSAGATQYSPFG